MCLSNTVGYSLDRLYPQSYHGHHLNLLIITLGNGAKLSNGLWSKKNCVNERCKQWNGANQMGRSVKNDLRAISRVNAALLHISAGVKILHVGISSVWDLGKLVKVGHLLVRSAIGTDLPLYSHTARIIWPNNQTTHLDPFLCWKAIARTACRCWQMLLYFAKTRCRLDHTQRSVRSTGLQSIREF